MTNEIKEIKVNKANKSIIFINNGIAFSQFGIADEILDLITNLQEENEKLKKAVKENVIATCNTCELFGVCPHSYKEYDYKVQIDKAIEYIKWNLDKNEELIEYFNYDANFNELLDILKGDKHE